MEKKFTALAFLLFFTCTAFANTNLEFATGRDILVQDTSSSITLNHNTGGSIDVTGIYIQALCYNSGCSTTTNGYANKHGLAFGAMYNNVTFANNASTTIGSNFLYNMVHHALYQANHTSSTLGSTYTPGQKGTGDSNNAWYIKLGVITSTPAAHTNAIATEALTYASSTSISTTCNDTTFRCTAGSSSTQSF